MKQVSDYYSTPSLPLAATLCLTYPLDHIDRTNPPRFNFVFERTLELDTFLEAYWRHQLQVEPQAYSEQLRQLKIRIHEDS